MKKEKHGTQRVETHCQNTLKCNLNVFSVFGQYVFIHSVCNKHCPMKICLYVSKCMIICDYKQQQQ